MGEIFGRKNIIQKILESILLRLNNCVIIYHKKNQQVVHTEQNNEEKIIKY